MDTLIRAFAKMGARIKFAEIVPNRWLAGRQTLDDFNLDVRRDAKGEHFLMSRAGSSSTEFVVLDVQPRDRHLLLLSRKQKEKHRFLLGYEERHWFVAGIPEVTPVSRVKDAKEALKPEAVHTSERGIRGKELERRINRARARQGEWFFVPAPGVNAPPLLILRNEPLVRSGGKGHFCAEVIRFGGETVYVSGYNPRGITQDEYNELADGDKKHWNWRVMQRNPRVYVRGRVRHPDHKTIELNGWHEVFSNTENLSYAMRNIVFLD
jgi:hypothetical protein